MGPRSAPDRRDRAVVLVGYCALQWPWRKTIEDHLYSFRRYGDATYLYVNLAVPWLANAYLPARPDAVIWHTTFLGWVRWTPPAQRIGVMKRARRIAAGAPFQVALPQDEFLRSAQVSEVMREFGVDHVFSVAPESEWPLIYDGLDPDRVRFSRVLTGYLDEDTVRRIDAIVAEGRERTIDIGYRTGPPKPFLGRHAMLKTEVAEVVRERALARGLNVDISTRAEDTLLGDDWYRWLARCRYTLGVEGGASVLDRDGSILDCTQRVERERPEASFEEIEAACFPGEDGKLELHALSPRHLEACATHTAQILVEGEYNGILQPNSHYLPLRRDFSNLDTLLDAVAAGGDRERVAAAAHRDIVASGPWTYRRLVADVEAWLPRAAPRRLAGLQAVVSRALDSATKPLLPLATRALMPLRRRVYGTLRLRGYGRSEAAAAPPPGR
jgi:hypothetical protein